MSTRQEVGQCAQEHALGRRASVMTIGSDGSSAAWEECQKRLLLLSPTELLLRHLIGTSGVSPRAAGSVPAFPELHCLPGACAHSVHQAPRAVPGCRPAGSPQSAGLSWTGRPWKIANARPCPVSISYAGERLPSPKRWAVAVTHTSLGSSSSSPTYYGVSANPLTFI